MVFNSVQFAVFFAVVYCLYRVLPHRAQNVMLLLASYLFYSAWDWRFLGLLIGSTFIDFQSRATLPALRSGEAPPRLLLSLVYNLGCSRCSSTSIFSAKDSVMCSAHRWDLDPITIHVILPMGISFYTFMTISYVIDVYRDEIPPHARLLVLRCSSPTFLISLPARSSAPRSCCRRSPRAVL